MPSYPYKCLSNHSWDLIRSMKNAPSDKQPCPKCGRTGDRQYVPIETSGTFTQRTRDLLSVPFGRKKAQGFERAGDVDRALADFDKRYGHFGSGASHPEKDFS